MGRPGRQRLPQLRQRPAGRLAAGPHRAARDPAAGRRPGRGRLRRPHRVPARPLFGRGDQVMRIHLLAESAPNPVLTAVMEELARQHEVAVHDAQTLPAGYGREPGLEEPPDVVLLKSRTPEARRVAETAERAGALVVNRPAATAAALDRALTAAALDRAGVPAPRSWSVPALRDLAADGGALPWPLVVKSRTSSRRDQIG